MPILITPYGREHADGVRQFNARLAGTDYREFHFPEEPPPPGAAPGGRCEEAFVAVDGAAVRGGYILRHQNFLVNGQLRSMAHYTLPVSEGVLNRAYAGVGLQMVRAALKSNDLLFALGMGGLERPLPRMLKALGWNLHAVPFLFRILRPRRVLSEIQVLRNTPFRRFAAAAARATGTGWLSIRILQGMNRRSFEPAVAAETGVFSPWADDVWRGSKDRYAMIGVRDGAALDLLYPSCDPRFVRLRVGAGWAVLLVTQMRADRHFGNLRVGSIVDCLAAPEGAGAVIAAAAAALERRGVDLIISNQAHATWQRALRHAGFLRGPSNFIFAASPKLAALLVPFETRCASIHLNRGDGDGTVHL